LHTQSSKHGHRRKSSFGGGAVNPYKDARMGAETFAASFPEWHRLEAFRDPAIMSSFWARTARKLDPRHGTAEAAECHLETWRLDDFATW